MIDELDGSSSFQVGHYEWSVSVSFVRELEFLAGAVYAPKILNGTLFYASRGRGAFERSGKRGKRLKVGESKLKDAYIVFGVDCFLEKYPIYNRLLKKLGNPARTTNGVGSCALGLGLVAAGRIDALIQPPQSPWDYSAGKVLVEEAGGRFFFTRS
jgi:myo-inositol-1(or 4)-monophosphatase